MQNKDREAIAKLYLEAWDRSQEYNWDNPYKGDIRKLKQHETNIDIDSERVVKHPLTDEFSADPDDYPNRMSDFDGENGYPTRDELLNNPVMVLIYDKIRNDKDFAFYPTQLGDMDPPNTWSDSDILEIVEYALGDSYDILKEPRKNAKQIYQLVRNFFARNVAKNTYNPSNDPDSEYGGF